MKSRQYEQRAEAEYPARRATSTGSEALAERLEAGAAALASFAAALSEEQWQTRLPKDGRKVGVVVHHVASMYPLGIQLAMLLAAGRPVTGVTWDAVDSINRDHARDNDGVTKEAALTLLASNSAAVARTQSEFTDRRSR